ncbi:Zinc finger, RanBP2-type [Cynara cardunculus var. scolymus]|uniref:Zinc finger, RanBP2-type n=1 Tax=Cynara cardunculus var. scolymus TaxID=59895 RepID=A0A103XCW8_CYNCS|nr:Zinc finger, RanBP2-type [Cynara cardunculus var. scolymus]
MSRPGDWNCRSCQHLNFQRRDSCQRCGEPKHGGFGGRGGITPSAFGFTAGPDVRPGDWGFGFGGGSGGGVGGAGGGSSRSGWKSGDWICGSRADRDAMNTTLQVEWNVLVAMHQENPQASLHINSVDAIDQFYGMEKRKERNDKARKKDVIITRGF